MKKIRFLLFVFTPCFISLTVFTHKKGPPTGVAGEPPLAENCAVSGCHTGSAVNSGGGTSAIVCKDSLNGLVTQYVPNHTYSITLSITEGIKTRYGFEAIVMKGAGANAISIGTIILTQPNETQLLGGSRINILHKLTGIDFTGNKGSWTFDWKAPSANLGTATIYAAFNASNNDEEKTDDIIYETKLNLLGTGPVVGITPGLNATIASLFSNPTGTELTFELQSPSSITIYTLNSKIIKTVNSSSLFEKINIADFPLGMYLVKVVTSDEMKSFKFIKF